MEGSLQPDRHATAPDQGQIHLESRARFISVEEGFNIKRPPPKPHAFDAERDRALDPATPSGIIELDMSATLLTPYAATTPLLLAKYIRVRDGQHIDAKFHASAEIYYVIQGTGLSSQNNGTTLGWNAGDLFCLPGGALTTHRATLGDAVLYSVTDEPLLAFCGVAPLSPPDAPLEAVLYSAARMARELQALYSRSLGPATAGRALFLTSSKREASRTCTPALTMTLNAVLPGESQPAHRHNAAAIVFIMQGGSVSSTIGDQTFVWDQASVLLTPPNATHSHANAGRQSGVALIVQDGGLHYHCRTMGFEFM
jgi:gentisate 1,2-dioxygenase